MKGTIVPNPFKPAPVLPADREALYGGLISAGHPVEYARAQADTLPDADGALQMLARHRLAAHDDRRAALRTEIINQPETADFMAGVPLEAAHQRERWGAEHDAGKSPFDWFWLIGYLAQKAADAATRGNAEKAMHHTISTAAALANWHASISGADTAMRPGIKPPFERELAEHALPTWYDIEVLLREWPPLDRDDTWYEMLRRWRAARGEAGKEAWRWWWRCGEDEEYQTDHATRDDALAAARREAPAWADIHLIEARTWADDFDENEDITPFAETANHEVIAAAAPLQSEEEA